MILLWKEFLFAGLAVIGFAILFNVSYRLLPYVFFSGALGWTLHVFLQEHNMANFIAVFFSAALITLLGEVLARFCKKPATTFIVPSVIPLVPGDAIYLSMSQLISRDFDLSAFYGIEAILTSLAISLGIIVITSLSTIIKKISVH